MAYAEMQLSPASFLPLDDGNAHPAFGTEDLGTVTVAVLRFALNDIADFTFKVPRDIDTSGTVTFRIQHLAETAAASKNTEYTLGHRPIDNGEAIDGAYTTEVSGDLAMDATQDDLNEHTWTETVTNLGWAANDQVFAQLSRTAASADELSGDDMVTMFTVEVPIS